MKKISLLIILLLFLFTTASSQVIDEPYDFPERGTPEWEQLSPSERYQVPDDILKRLSTKALVETCLNYPRFPEFGLSSQNLKVGIGWVISWFNGFGELFSRQDAFICLFEKYEPFDLDLVIKEGDLRSKFAYIEILLFQDEIIENMNYEEKILLLKDSYSKHKKFLELELWNGNPHAFAFYLMAQLLVSLDEPEITDEINNSENIKFLLNTLWWEFGTEREIEALVNKVLKDNEKETPIIIYSLSQNYPNPFNPTTTIQYSISRDAFVKLTVYDITGKVVKELISGHKTAGKYSVEFNAIDLASGIYFYKLNTSGRQMIKKMMLLK
jgi:hypothetical protein